MLSATPPYASCPSCFSFDVVECYARKSNGAEQKHSPNMGCSLCRGSGLIRTEVAAKFCEAYNQTSVVGSYRSPLIEAFLNETIE
jgi:hypothetical protein